MSELMHYTPRKGNHKYIDVKIVNGKPQYIYSTPGRGGYSGTSGKYGGRTDKWTGSSGKYSGSIDRWTGTGGKYHNRNGLRVTVPSTNKWDGSSGTYAGRTDKWSGSSGKYSGKTSSGNLRVSSPTPESYKDGSKMTRRKRRRTTPSSGVLPRFIPTSESYKNGSSMKRRYKASPTPESYKDGSSMRRRYKASSTPEANKAGTGIKTNYAANRAKANGVNAWNYKYNSEQMKSGSAAAHTPNYAPNKQTLAKRTGSQSNYSHNSEKFKSGTTITRSVGTAKENRHKRTDAATKNKKITTGYQQYRTTPENMKSGSMAGRSANNNKQKNGLWNTISNGWNKLKKKLGWR